MHCLFSSVPLSDCLKDCEEDVLHDQDCKDIDLDLKDGCNQMFSCSHACAMRHLGMGEEKCLHQCNRTGSSGCSEKISFYHQKSDSDVECEFSLCEKCKRKGCESRYPKIEECESGCKSYCKLNDIYSTSFKKCKLHVNKNGEKYHLNILQ